MSDNSETLKKKNCYTFAGCLDQEKEKVTPNNEIAKIIFEMVDITSGKDSEKACNKEEKSEAENDVPVRRSHRIRKSVVKRDEVTLPVSKKTNKKNASQSKLSHQKSVVEHQSESKDSSENLNEKAKASSNKSSKCDSKGKRAPPKCVLSTEKKKTSRKTKKGEKSPVFVDNDNVSAKTSDAETTALSLNPDESSRSESSSAATGSTEDNGSEATEKQSESSKPVKVKSRWWRSSELEAVLNSEPPKSPSAPPESLEEDLDVVPPTKEDASEKDASSSPNLTVPTYDHIEENIYRFNRKKCKGQKQVRRMVCDCTLTREEQECGVLGCQEECLNRLLMIECGSRCPLGDACSNKKFQKKEYAKAEIFKTEKKGWGLRMLEDISSGDFVLEFVGEILNHREYRQRVKQYAKNVHSYFMALRPDQILDATVRGNFSRFINHSCEPNCETQKWTVNGDLRVGVFAKRSLRVGEELTLDYKFQRYGREAQKCFCGAESCSGFIGAAKQISIEAYSGGGKIRKRKGSEDKREDMILEEEIEKLDRGLRNREDTLKLARLMVRADDVSSRHQLLNIILRTEEQACLRLFLDYHGLPLLWSWMTDVSEFQLKAKILQVLSLLPISNKTMLLDSKVMSIVEKWLSEESISGGAVPSEEPCTASKRAAKDFSDSETDSTSSHNNNETAEAVPEEPQEDPPKEPNIASLASVLIQNWKNLKEVFRIPRLEQQKRKEDEMEVDAKVIENDERPPPAQEEPCGDHIQVVISGKNVFSDHRRAYDFESDVKMEDCPRRFSRTPPVLAKPRQVVSKPVRHQVYPKPLDPAEMTKDMDIPKIPGDLLPSQQNLSCPPPPFANQPPIAFPPPLPMENPSQPLLYPPHIMYPPSQLPFVGSSAPVLPPNPAVMPPPASVTAPPPLIQPPPTNAGMSLPPPTQQPNIVANNFLLPPTSVVPGTSQFVPNRPFPPPVYPNQNPVYFIPPQTAANPTPISFPENVVVKEDPKPIKLPRNWRTATDSEGNVYYYHSVTRQTQWDPPSEEEDSDDEEDSNSEESESSDTPTYDEPKLMVSKKRPRKRKKPTKAAADTSVVPIRPEVAKKIKELFRTKMSSFIVYCLNAYRKSDCTTGRITSNEDFKYLARKLTHYTMTKELKQCKNVEDLDCNETVMHKAKDFIRKYMAKYGHQYTRKSSSSASSPPL